MQPRTVHGDPGEPGHREGDADDLPGGQPAAQQQPASSTVKGAEDCRTNEARPVGIPVSIAR